MFKMAGRLQRKWLYNRHKGPVMHHTYFFTQESLSKIIDKCGFQILFARTLNEDMLIRSNMVGGRLIKKILYKVGALIERGPIIEIMARKQ
jgi:hypothetical protein